MLTALPILPDEPAGSEALVHTPTPDAFPNFRSGDVVIETKLGSTPVTFQLHSAVLARHSPWFRNAFQATDIGDEQRTTWSFSIEEIGGKIEIVQQHVHGDRLTFHCPVPEPVSPIKIEVTSDDSVSMSTRNSSSVFEGPALAVRPLNGSAAVSFYFQILGSFYNIAPPVSTTDISTALVQSIALVEIAGALGCLGLIRPHIGNVLGQYHQRLFMTIKADPPRWLLLALTLQDTSIYTESLIHLVGAHPSWPWPTKRTTLHPKLCQLIANKSASLDLMCIEAERDLLIATIKIGKDPVNPRHQGQIETWMVVQIFRDALARHLHTVNNSITMNSKTRGAFFRGLCKGSYMDSEAVRGMCQDIMKSSWQDLGDDLKQLKVYAAQIVGELAENQLMIDPDTNNVGYLTCIKIQPQDIPWCTEGQSAF